MTHTHIIDGQFQSDRYPTAPRDTVPMDIHNPRFQDLIWIYAERWRTEDPAFADDLQDCLRRSGFEPEKV